MIKNYQVRLTIGLCIIIYIAYGWFDTLMDQSRAAKTLEYISTFSLQGIKLQNVTDEYYNKPTIKKLNTSLAKGSFLKGLESCSSSSSVRPPEHQKIYLELKTDEDKYGFELLIPLNSKDDAHITLVNRVYTRQSYSQESLGKFKCNELNEFYKIIGFIH